MTSRREFLQIGIAASTLPLAAHAARAAGVPAGGREPSDTVPLYAALYDTRFPDSVAFARRASALGVRVQAMEGDMTRFWYDDLYHRWQHRPVAIAGLTEHGALFCLERLAWDQRLRVVFRAEHKPAQDCVAHHFSGPQPMLSAARRAAADASWAERMADVVTQCPSGRAEITAVRAQTPAASLTTPDSDSLFSWVIAPAVRV
jgi:hypothetical protein